MDETPEKYKKSFFPLLLQYLLPMNSLHDFKAKFAANEICELEPVRVYRPLNPGLFSNSLVQSLQLHTKIITFFSEAANF